jgi:4-amino-4-deoxy-L-arabinose transferase-like glycosyltransferase
MSLGGLTAALGAWRLGQDRERRWLLIFILLGPALLIAHLYLGNTRPYHWYLIPILPNLFLLWAAAWPNARARFRFPQMALVLATLAGVHLLALPTARLLTRSITNPRHPDYGKEAITASPGMMTEAYDPAVNRFKTAEELRTLIDRARSEKKPLFINFGYRALLADAHPAIFALIDDPALFERVQLFPGQFFSATREVYRLRTVQD